MPDVLLTEVEVVELKSVFDLHSRMFLNLLMLTNLNRSLITSLKLLWRVAYMIRIGILRNMRFCRFLTEKSISILPETSIAESLLPSSSFTNFKVIVHLVSDSDVAAGHVDNIFQARIMPFTDDRTIVTSAADGQVRLGQIAENGHVQTKKLGKHHGRVHKLAVEPGSPHIFYSCGEDGLVQHFDLRSNSSTKLFCCTPFTELNHSHSSSNTIRLNSIIIDPRNPNFFSIGGSDKYARLYDIRNFDQPVNTFCPKHLTETHDVHITGMSYSNTSELLISYNDELIYLFQKNNGGLGPNPLNVMSSDDLEDPQVYCGHRNSLTVKGVSFFGPNCEYVMSGSDCGHIFIWKKKGGRLVRVMEGDRRIVNQVEPHPSIPVLASSGLEKNIKLWVPVSDDILPLPHDLQEIVESNRRGREDHSRVTLTPDVIMHVLRLHRRQALAYIERRRNRDELGSDDEEEDEGDGYVMGFSDADGSLDDGNSTECNIV